MQASITFVFSLNRFKGIGVFEPSPRIANVFKLPVRCHHVWVKIRKMRTYRGFRLARKKALVCQPCKICMFATDQQLKCGACMASSTLNRKMDLEGEIAGYMAAMQSALF